MSTKTKATIKQKPANKQRAKHHLLLLRVGTEQIFPRFTEVYAACLASASAILASAVKYQQLLFILCGGYKPLYTKPPCNIKDLYARI
jgi:hypothetical protein